MKYSSIAEMIFNKFTAAKAEQACIDNDGEFEGEQTGPFVITFNDGSVIELNDAGMTYQNQTKNWS